MSEPRTIGRFEVRASLGAGGMARVLRAHDPRLGRDVALKLLDDTGDSRVARDRALREARALARLRHPNVVVLHDVLEHDGALVLALELVDGCDLREWLGRAEHSWREIVAAFVAAGHGLAAAHRAGVIHRDFKPSNVLVDREGRVRVADFGIALAGAQVDAAHDPDAAATPVVRGLTDPELVVGTPGYMAPEHREGRADARSDQFSFCVSLWEALVGERPGPRHADDPWPSGRPVPRRLLAALARGLAPEPTRRWPAMDDLLRALERATTRRWPVPLAIASTLAVVLAAARLLAAPACPSAGERERLWTDDARARVDASFRAGGLEATMAVVDATLQSWDREWITARDESCRAMASGRDSAAVTDLRTLCLGRRERQFDTAVELLASGDPEVLARALDVLEAVDPPARCSDLLALTGGLPPIDDPQLRAEVEAVRDEVAALAVRLDAGQAVFVREHAPAVVERARASGQALPLAEALVLAAKAATLAGVARGAEAQWFDALTAARAADHPGLEVRIYIQLVRVQGLMLQRFDLADDFAALADAVLERLPEADEELRASLLAARGAVAMRRSDLAAADDAYSRAIELRIAARGADDVKVSAMRQDLALVRIQQGRLDEAHVLLDRSTRDLERVVGEHHASLVQYDVNLANYWMRRGRLADARAALAKARARAEATLPVDSYRRGILANTDGVLHLQERDHRAALASFRRAEVVLLHALGPEHIELARVWNNIASSYVGLGDRGQAVVYWRRSLALKEAAYGQEHPSLVTTLGNLGDDAVDRGAHDEALALHRRALAIAEARLGDEHPEHAVALRGVARAALAAGRPGEAVTLLERAIAIHGRTGAAPLQLGESCFMLAKAQRDSGGSWAESHTWAVAAAFWVNAAGRPKELEEIRAWMTDTRSL